MADLRRAVIGLEKTFEYISKYNLSHKSGYPQLAETCLDSATVEVTA